MRVLILAVLLLVYSCSLIEEDTTFRTFSASGLTSLFISTPIFLTNPPATSVLVPVAVLFAMTNLPRSSDPWFVKTGEDISLIFSYSINITDLSGNKLYKVPVPHAHGGVNNAYDGHVFHRHGTNITLMDALSMVGVFTNLYQDGTNITIYRLDTLVPVLLPFYPTNISLVLSNGFHGQGTLQQTMDQLALINNQEIEVCITEPTNGLLISNWISNDDGGRTIAIYTTNLSWLADAEGWIDNDWGFNCYNTSWNFHEDIILSSYPTTYFSLCYTHVEMTDRISGTNTNGVLEYEYMYRYQLDDGLDMNFTNTIYYNTNLDKKGIVMFGDTWEWLE